MTQDHYWIKVGKDFCKHRLGVFALLVVALMGLGGMYAPFLASSKPIVMIYDGIIYFPLFRYLFYSGFYTKGIDLFFNLAMFAFPVFLLCLLIFRRSPKIQRPVLVAVFLFQIIFSVYLIYRKPHDPASDPFLNQEKMEQIQETIKVKGVFYPDWNFDLKYMTPYAKLNVLLGYLQKKERDRWLREYTAKESLPTLWQTGQEHEKKLMERAEKTVVRFAFEKKKDAHEYQMAVAKARFLKERKKWIEQESQKVTFALMPLLRSFHSEDDTGGSSALNQILPWYELARGNHRDLVASLVFGIRISLVVGTASVALALLIGVPIGAAAGFCGGKVDMMICRVLEVWEAMPTFFMLLLAVAILQSKSIFLVILIIGVFGWTNFSRYIRGEFLKQKNLAYVEACKAQGFSSGYTIFTHILPNAIPPLLTLLPFAFMAAVTSESALAFLGLAEEGSSSWGVLMDEGRQAFPAESSLLWPPAILLTILLVAFAITGDVLRDVLDPKLKN